MRYQKAPRIYFYSEVNLEMSTNVVLARYSKKMELVILYMPRVRHTLPLLPCPITPYSSDEASDDDSDISVCGDSTDSGEDS